MKSSLLQIFRTLIRRLKEAIRSKQFARYATIAAVTLPFAIAMMFVLSLGPQIQTYALALFYADNASIYGSAYQTGLASFPKIRTWLLDAIDWRFAILAVAITLYSLRKPTPRAMSALAGLSSFVTLCALDALSATASNGWTLQYAAENAVMNLLGALVIAVLFLLLATLYDFLFNALPLRPNTRRLVCVPPIALGGVLVSAFAYYACAFLYKPIPARVTAMLAAPVSGSAFFRPSKSIPANPEAKEQASPFQFLPAENHAARLKWLSPQNSIEAHWQRGERAGSFTATIELFADCFDEAIDSAQSISAHVIRLPGIKDLQMQFDPGGSSIFTPASDLLEGKLRLQSSGSLFWLENEAGKRQKYTQFVDKNPKIDLSASEGVAFYLSADLFSKDDKIVTLQGRSIAILADGQSLVFAIEPQRNSPDTKKLACRSIPPLKNSGALSSHPTSWIGALVRIRRDPSERTYSSDASQLVLANGNGWVTVEAERPDAKMRNHPSGTLNFISFAGAIAHFTVDDQVVTTRAGDHFIAMGDFHVSFHSATEVHLTGTTYAMWKNQERMNPTKFESLGEKTRFAFLTGLGAALLWLAKYCASLWKANRPMATLLSKP